MKIAFIEPSVAHVEPLGIAYLGQALLEAGHEPRYFEASRPNFFGRLQVFRPDVLAYSVTTGKHHLCRSLNKIIRSKINAFSIFGGPHCTFYPQFIESDPLIDGACRGEGERAVVELINSLAAGKNYTLTPNWWVRREGEIYKNEIGGVIENINALSPNRDMLYEENTDMRDNPIKRIYATRGCPYKCSYCFNKQYNEIYGGTGKMYRARTADNIVKEVRKIQEKCSVTFIKFVDDIFGIAMNYDEFADVYGKEVGIPFVCNIRPNLITEAKVKCLKRAGCVAVTIAVESGNEFVRNRLLNRNLDVKVLENAITTLKKEGIRVWTQNIIANPGETFQMALETLNLNIKHRVNFAECFLLTPYPGTDIYKYCVDNNYFGGDVDTLQKSYWIDSCIHFDDEREKKRLVNFHKFFSFTVQHPWSLPIIKLVIELPRNKAFMLFNRLYDSWRISRLIRAKFTARNFYTTVRTNLKHIFGYFIHSEEKSWDHLIAEAEQCPP